MLSLARWLPWKKEDAVIAIFLALALSSQPASQLAAPQTRPEVLAQELLTTYQRAQARVQELQQRGFSDSHPDVVVARKNLADVVTTIQRLSEQIAQAEAARPNQAPLTPEQQAARDRAVRRFLVEQLRYVLKDLDENLARVEKLPAEDLTRLRDYINALNQAASLLRQVK